MVACINNDTAQFHPAYKTRGQVFTTENTDTAPTEETPISSYSPLLAAAKNILRTRLAIEGEENWRLDGRPASLKSIVDAANRVIRELGGYYLAYPGLRGRYSQSVPTLRINQPVSV